MLITTIQHTIQYNQSIHPQNYIIIINNRYPTSNFTFYLLKSLIIQLLGVMADIFANNPELGKIVKQFGDKIKEQDVKITELNEILGETKGQLEAEKARANALEAENKAMSDQIRQLKSLLERDGPPQNQKVKELIKIINERRCQIWLPDKNIDNNELKEIIKNVGSKQVVTLNLKSNKIDDEGLKILAEADFSNLEFCVLSNNNITDAGINHFLNGKWPKLEHLCIADTKIGDNAVAKLNEAIWPALQHLSLYKNNKISAQVKDNQSQITNQKQQKISVQFEETIYEVVNQ